MEWKRKMDLEMGLISKWKWNRIWNGKETFKPGREGNLVSIGREGGNKKLPVFEISLAENEKELGFESLFAVISKFFMFLFSYIDYSLLCIM
jgi:hypothetical protein